MNYPKDSADRFYARINRERRTGMDQEDLSDLYEEGKAIWVSGVGFVPKRRRLTPGGSDDH